MGKPLHGLHLDNHFKTIITSDISGWSAPSAVGVAGIGGGLEFGAEVLLLQ